METLPEYYLASADRIFKQAQTLAKTSIESETRDVYFSGCRKFYTFCIEVCPELRLPLTDIDYAMFYAWLLDQNLAKGTCDNYLNHVAFMSEVLCRIPHPTWSDLPFVSRCKKSKLPRSTTQRRRKLPVTLDIAYTIIDCYPQYHPDEIDALDPVCLFLCLLLVGIVGLFRLGELIPKSITKFHPEKLIRLGQVSFSYPPDSSAVARIWLFRSKGDKFNEGVPVFLPASKLSRRYCPVAWLECLTRLSKSKHPTSPLFRFPDGRLVGKPCFIKWLRGRLCGLGHQPSLYSGHSLRAGGAVSAAKVGVPDHVIKMLGRWRSDAYLLYVKYVDPDLQDLRKQIEEL